MIIFAVVSMMAFAALGTSCSVTDNIKEKIDQIMCTHKGERYVVEGVAATCTVDGLTAGEKCKDCNAWTVYQEVVPAAHNKSIELGYAATCTEDGKTDSEFCLECGMIFKVQKTIPALGHNVVDVAQVNATVFEDGMTAGRACGNCCLKYSGFDVIPAGFYPDDYEVVTATEIQSVENKLFCFEINNGYHGEGGLAVLRFSCPGFEIRISRDEVTLFKFDTLSYVYSDAKAEKFLTDFLDIKTVGDKTFIQIKYGTYSGEWIETFEEGTITRGFMFVIDDSTKFYFEALLTGVDVVIYQTN